MALTPNLIQAAILANRSAGLFAFMGMPFDQMALGIGVGISSWAISQPSNLALTGIATGVAGAGSIVTAASRILVPPTVAALTSGLTGAGMVGPVAPALATTVTLGVSQAFNTYAQYFGLVAGVANGADVSRITVANPGTLVLSLQSALAGSMGSGPALNLLATGLGVGLTNLLLLGTGQATVVGIPSYPPVPATTSTLSVVV
jgi:hypothetical protein